MVATPHRPVGLRLVGPGVVLALVLTACTDGMGPMIPLAFTDVDAGGRHSCGLTVGGSVYCWGFGERGELGDGKVTTSAVPVRIQRELVFTSLSTGDRRTCAVTSEGVVYCWGWNRFGQLGTDQTIGQGVPVPIVSGERFTEVSAGWYHTCALNTEGAAFCWGYNGQGQLGDGSSASSTRPAAVVGGHAFATISAGAFHTCGVDVDGGTYCWGLNHLGQLGTGLYRNEKAPTPVKGGHGFVHVSAGFSHTCAVTLQGLAYCWGSDGHGELGNGVIGQFAIPGAIQPRRVHQGVFGGVAFHWIEAGREFTCAIDEKERGFCWGAGLDGQLGNNELMDWAVPRKVFATTDIKWKRIRVGAGTHACAVTMASGLFCWGNAEYGALGPETTFSAQPVRVAGTR